MSDPPRLSKTTAMRDQHRKVLYLYDSSFATVSSLLWLASHRVACIWPRPAGRSRSMARRLCCCWA